MKHTYIHVYTPVIHLQASDEESLTALEGLMTEFFDVLTTNERKRQIGMLISVHGQIKVKR